jgi:hypothetical protein
MIDVKALPFIFPEGIVLATTDRTSASVADVPTLPDRLTSLPSNTPSTVFPGPEVPVNSHSAGISAKPDKFIGDLSEKTIPEVKPIVLGSTPSIALFSSPEFTLKPANTTTVTVPLTAPAPSTANETRLPSTEINLPKSTLSVTPQLPLQYEGNYEQRFLIVSDKHLLFADYEFLFKVLGAINITISNIGLLNLERNTGYSLQDIITQLKPEKLICFGITDNNLIANPEYYAAYTKPLKMVFADPINKIPNHTEFKRKLWQALKSSFM